MTVPGAVGVDLFLDVGKQIGGVLHLIEDYRRRVQFQETVRHTHGSNIFQPAFLIQIEGRVLSTDITGEITPFVFKDNEEDLQVMELSVTNRNLRIVIRAKHPYKDPQESRFDPKVAKIAWTRGPESRGLTGRNARNTHRRPTDRIFLGRVNTKAEHRQ